MPFQERIKNQLSESIQNLITTADALTDPLNKAGQILVDAILNGNKVLACANGSSKADSERIVIYLTNHFEIERPSFPALSLSSDTANISQSGSSTNISDIFAKQVNTLGQTGDVLVTFSTNENSENILSAIQSAHDKAMAVIAFTSQNSINITGSLYNTDIELCAPSCSKAQTHTCHTVMINCLCDIIDQSLFGGY
jgi:DnaA initiator-associating protein